VGPQRPRRLIDEKEAHIVRIEGGGQDLRHPPDPRVRVGRRRVRLHHLVEDLQLQGPLLPPPLGLPEFPAQPGGHRPRHHHKAARQRQDRQGVGPSPQEDPARGPGRRQGAPPEGRGQADQPQAHQDGHQPAREDHSGQSRV